MGLTFFKSPVEDIQHVVASFNSHTVDNLVQFDENFSFDGNPMLMLISCLSLRILEGLILVPILVLLALMPLV